MPDFIFPTHLLNPADIQADVSPSVISGGVALNNEEDVIATDGGGRWAITYSGIVLRTPATIRLWDAWTSHLAGGARTILVPLVSLQTAPRPFAGSGIARPSQLAVDDQMFPSSVAFASPYIIATIVGAVALRSTTMTINVSRGARIQGGEKYEVNGRAYKIERVTARSGQQATCIVSPPAREAISNGAAVIFDWPKVRCRSLPGQDLSPALRFGRSAEVSISFVEDTSNAS